MFKLNGGRYRILAVDDDLQMLDIYADILGTQARTRHFSKGSEAAATEEMRLKMPDFSYDLVCARQGEEAVAEVRQSLLAEKPFALAFIDVRMPPGIDGVSTAARIREMDQDIRIVIVTGYSDIHPQDITRQVAGADKLIYLQKPLHRQEIFQLVVTLVSSWLLEKKGRQMRRELEEEVTAKTADIVVANQNLEDMNVALRVLLAQREKDRSEMEAQALKHLEEMVLPAIEILEKTALDERQSSLMDLVKANLGKIISPFPQHLQAHIVRLTPAELKIAGMIKQGKSTKEIAHLMNLSPRTIESHRRNIRKKMPQGQEKTGLRSLLQHD